MEEVEPSENKPPQENQPQFDLTQPPTEAERRHDADKNRRKSVVDRRTGVDRRQEDIDPDELAVERRMGDRRGSNTGLERRRGPGRRRTDDRRSAEEGE